MLSADSCVCLLVLGCLFSILSWWSVYCLLHIAGASLESQWRVRSLDHVVRVSWRGQANRKQRCVREGALASIVDSDSCADERVARGALRSQEPCLSVQLAPTGDDIEPLEVPRQDVELEGEEDKKPLEAEVPWARFASQESHQSSETRT